MQVFTAGQEVVTGEGRTVRQLLIQLELSYPGLKAALMDGDRLRADVRVAVDGQISQLGALQTLHGAREVTFLPAMAGG
jgi:molybdopterin converting factor small subunit